MVCFIYSTFKNASQNYQEISKEHQLRVAQDQKTFEKILIYHTANFYGNNFF
jgi:hypothetical protein